MPVMSATLALDLEPLLSLEAIALAELKVEILMIWRLRPNWLSDERQMKCNVVVVACEDDNSFAGSLKLT